ncbi:MAG: hypothetical protein AAGA59_08435 [Actinomycetota bacterium]
MSRRLPTLAAALLALALIAAACSDDDTTTAEADTNPEVSPSGETSSDEDSSESDEAGDPSTTEVSPSGETSSDEAPPGADGAETLLPDVLDATARFDGDGTWTVSATLSSPYDTPQRYADAWRVIGSDGTVYGVRELLHDHAGEQPFTRSLNGVEIPDDEVQITIEGRDQVSGWGGETVTIPLER